MKRKYDGLKMIYTLFPVPLPEAIAAQCVGARHQNVRVNAGVLAPSCFKSGAHTYAHHQGALRHGENPVIVRAGAELEPRPQQGSATRLR